MKSLTIHLPRACALFLCVLLGACASAPNREVAQAVSADAVATQSERTRSSKARRSRTRT